MRANTSERPRAIFFGTPLFSVTCLEVVHELCDLALVVTQPDRKAGRGLGLQAPAVKQRAEQLGLTVVQPRAIKKPAFAASLRAVEADLAVVVAYGRILTAELLAVARLGSFNVHASLLPRWRGAAPIQRVIAAGDRDSGVCLMQMDEGMDTGPVLSCIRTAIGPNETAGELTDRLSALGASLLLRDLPALAAGRLQAVEQDHALATAAPPVLKAEGVVDWTLSARQVDAHVRAMTPRPGAFSNLNGSRVKIHRARVATDQTLDAVPGTLLRCDRGGIEVVCGEGGLAIDELQLEGKAKLKVADFVAGARWNVGQRFQEAAADDA